MSIINEISNPYLGAFAGGLVYGLVVCTASCVPYIASYIAGVGAGFRKGITITMIFSGGRIAGYAVIGVLVGLFSGLFRLVVSQSVISPFRVYSSLVFGAITIAIGVFVLFRVRTPKCDCSTQDGKNSIASAGKGRFGVDL